MNLNVSKAVVALVALICITVLMALGSITSAAGMPVITMIVGYVVGNGITSKQGREAEPIISPKRKEPEE